MLPLAVELLRLADESCATMHLGMLRSLCGGAVDLRRRNTALLSGGSVVAPHRRANGIDNGTFFPDFDISIPFNAHLLIGIGLRGTGVLFTLILVLAIITWRR